MTAGSSPGRLQLINLASSSDLKIGSSSKPCTTEVQLASEFTLDGRSVTLVDTPGFDGTTKNRVEVSIMIADFLARMLVHISFYRFSIFRTEPLNRYEEGSKLAGVIYVHRISDKQLTGTAERDLEVFHQLCGDASLRNVHLFVNMCNEVSPEIDEAHEKELSGNIFRPVLRAGAQMVHYQNTVQSAHNIIRKIMKNHPVTLQIQREMVDECKDILDTAAGRAIKQELDEQAGQHQARLREVQEEMEQATDGGDEGTRQEREEERGKLEEQMGKIGKYLAGMAWNYAVEKKMAQERERVDAEHERQLADFQRKLRDTANASAADRARWIRKRKKLQDRFSIPIYK